MFSRLPHSIVEPPAAFERGSRPSTRPYREIAYCDGGGGCRAVARCWCVADAGLAELMEPASLPPRMLAMRRAILLANCSITTPVPLASLGARAGPRSNWGTLADFFGYEKSALYVN